MYFRDGKQAATTPSSYEECLSLANEERWTSAITACKRAVEDLSVRDEKFAEALLKLSESHESSGNPWLALDALKRIVSDTDFKKYQERALVRKSRIHTKFGDFASARSTAEQIEDKDRKNAVLVGCEKADELYKTVAKSYREERWTDVDKECRELIAGHTPYFRDAFDMRIKALSSKRETERAIEVARSKARIESDPSETDFLIGKLYLSMANLASGRKFIIACCQLNPENRKCMSLRSKIKHFESVLEDVEKKMLLKEAVDALEDLRKLIEAVPKDEPYYDENFPQLFQGFKLSILKLLCTKQARRKQVTEAVQICEEAKKLDPNHLDYYLIVLGELYLALDRYEDALNHFQQAHAFNRSNPQVKELIEKAEKVKREKWATRYYDILGVKKDASPEEIKKAHSRMVRRYHPDKLNDGAAKKEAEQKMQEINAAYDVLGDKNKRQQYDSGIDPNDPNAGAQGFHHGGFGGPFGGFGGFHSGARGGGGGHQFTFNMEDLSDLFAGGGRGSKGKKKGRRGGFDFFRDDL